MNRSLSCAVACAAGVLLAGGFVSQSAQAASASFLTLPGSVQSTTDADVGEYTASNMTIELVLAPSNAGQIESLLSSVYNPLSPGYKQWLSSGQFQSMFAPNAGQVAELTQYLQSTGLSVSPGGSPFFLQVSGPSSTITAALKTSIRNYRNPQGVSYFANATTMQLPASLASSVLGVVGATNTVRLQSRTAFHKHTTHSPGCETPYVTTSQLYAAVNDGTSFPYGYGGGPGCQGLSPSQTNSIYEAPSLGSEAQGHGVNLGLFELSAYQHSDIATWTRQFYGARYTAPLEDITVDGGPLKPVCPSGDSCPAEFNGYSGDIEVDADIEMQLSVAPAASHIMVYNAPNDFTGQTSLDEYSRIAQDNKADVISSSWGVCENDLSAGYVQAENLIFEQMALQGQSMLAATGDTGAFGCIRSDGTTIVDVGDPAEPWVTTVGGTSFTSFNPGTNPYPSYPSGEETVWNVDNLCNASSDEGGQNGYFWCAATGAGNGGSSQWWGRPFYQAGYGVTNRYTLHGNGSTNCALAKKGTPCRETPDVSANADPYTPYAEYCTGSAATPFSVCATIATTPAGWFGIGGTSLSSPLWSGIIADRVGFQHRRAGNANALLYWLFDLDAPGYFNDITGIRQPETNNGVYPTTPGYDLATGIGSPRMAALITGFPEL